MISSFYDERLAAADIKLVKGIGAARAACFLRLGVATVADLLEFYPRRYNDFTAGTGFQESYTGNMFSLEDSCVKARVTGRAQRIPTKNRSVTLYKVGLTDEKGVPGFAVFFNAEYAAASLVISREYCFIGRLSYNSGRFELLSPEYMAADDEKGLLVPVYPQTKGLNSKAIGRAVYEVLTRYADEIADPLPPEIAEKNGLCGLAFALRNIHFPKDSEALAAARRRLAFGELLLHNLALRYISAQKQGVAHEIGGCDMERFYKALPFELTKSQKSAILEALADMEGSAPMNRLLQGDVGSGKTAVCTALMYSVACAGRQAALMAPTELLANQHYATVSGHLGGLGIKTALITGSTKKSQRREILSELAAGRIDVIVGTHALFSEDVEFSSLALVISDEQHRFGVKQRASLAAKGAAPHMYVMSATPIPRTLSLLLFGDLKVSRLDMMPSGRKEIKTYIFDHKGTERARVFGFIKNELAAGRQAYIVCPAIEDNENGREAVTSYYKEAVLSHFTAEECGLLHGRLGAAEKNEVMSGFVSGRIKLLVATTVIEVGIDVKNATVMVIENADSFGLAQLHQLRGRVGRGEHQSHCVLMTQNAAPASLERLRVLKDSADGFEIAEKDLQLRGPGDFLGSRQSGLRTLKLAGASDLTLLEQAKTAAEAMKYDPPQLYVKMIDEAVNQIGLGGLS